MVAYGCAIPAPGRWRQEPWKFKTSKSYSVSLKLCKLERGREREAAAAIQLLGKPQKKVYPPATLVLHPTGCPHLVPHCVQ